MDHQPQFLSPEDAAGSQAGLGASTSSLTRPLSNNGSAVSVQTATSAGQTATATDTASFQFSQGDVALDDLPPDVANADLFVASTYCQLAFWSVVITKTSN